MLINFSAAEKIARILGGKKNGNGWIIRCVAHDDRSPSLSIADGREGRLLVKCFAGCDASSVLMELKSQGLLDNNFKSESFVRNTPELKPLAKKEWSTEANSIWKKTSPLCDSIAKSYLQSRGCAIPDSDDLRFLPEYKGWPAMVGRVTCPLTNKPFTLHFTLLSRDGSCKAPIEKPKLMLFDHRSKGGVIRLSRDADVTIGLGLAEGVETALCCDWWPIWATVNSGNMSELPVLEGIEALTIFADNDKSNTGLKAATLCATRWRGAGRDVKIVMPTYPGKDWAS